MNRRISLLALLMLLAAAFMAACTTPSAATEEAGDDGGETGGEEATEEATEEGAASGSVVLWHAYQTGSTEEATLNELIAQAQEEYPGLEIEVLQVPFDQIFNKYQTEVAAGGGPDMYVAPNDDLGNWVRGSFVEPLDEYLSEDDLAGVSETGVAGMQVDGVLYGIPESAKAVTLYYNKSLVETPPTTTDELLEMVEGGATLTSNSGAYHMFGWAGAFGGELLDDSGTCIADQGGWVEALDYLLALQEAGAVFTNDDAAATGPFNAGETAFLINGPWALGDYRTSLGDDLGVAVLEGFAPLNGIDGFYINPNSENKQAAVDLALFLSSGERAQLYTDQAGHVPIREDVTSDDELVAAFAQASANGTPRPQSSEFANYWGPFGEMFTKVFEGAATPEEAVAEACAAMNAANGK